MSTTYIITCARLSFRTLTGLTTESSERSSSRAGIKWDCFICTEPDTEGNLHDMFYGSWEAGQGTCGHLAEAHNDVEGSISDVADLEPD